MLRLGLLLLCMLLAGCASPPESEPVIMDDGPLAATLRDCETMMTFVRRPGALMPPAPANWTGPSPTGLYAYRVLVGKCAEISTGDVAQAPASFLLETSRAYGPPGGCRADNPLVFATTISFSSPELSGAFTASTGIDSDYRPIHWSMDLSTNGFALARAVIGGSGNESVIEGQWVHSRGEPSAYMAPFAAAGQGGVVTMAFEETATSGGPLGVANGTWPTDLASSRTLSLPHEAFEGSLFHDHTMAFAPNTDGDQCG